ncbi:MAG: ParM/StbA family protein [Rhodocyclaceae bacterium]|nr:ParM/StbA family protein [Rhodocyclaceae bacterium]
MQHQHVVGLDIGHSAVKMTFDTDGGIKRAVFASLACPAIPLTNPLEAQRAKAETVEVDGRAYFVGETARLQGQAELPIGLRDNWIETREHAALLAQAVRLVMQEDKAQSSRRLWVLGLPVLAYARDRERLASIAERLLPPGDRIKVMQQPDAVYFSRIYTREGLPAADIRPEQEAWAIIDIGYYTTDFVVYERGRYIEAAAGRHDGVRSVVEAIQRRLAHQGIDRSVVEIEEALPQRRLIDRGEAVDFSAHAEQAMDDFTAKIVEEASRVMGRRINALNGVLVAGGAADLALSSFRKEWPHAQLARDEFYPDLPNGTSLHGPRFVISEGYYRYGKSTLVLEQYAKGGALS